MLSKLLASLYLSEFLGIQSPQVDLPDLPNEVWLQILNHLSSVDLGRSITWVSHRFHDLAQPTLLRGLTLHPYSISTGTSEAPVLLYPLGVDEKLARLEARSAAGPAAYVQTCTVTSITEISERDGWDGRDGPAADVYNALLIPFFTRFLPRFAALRQLELCELDLTREVLVGLATVAELELLTVIRCRMGREGGGIDDPQALWHTIRARTVKLLSTTPDDAAELTLIHFLSPETIDVLTFPRYGAGTDAVLRALPSPGFGHLRKLTLETSTVPFCQITRTARSFPGLTTLRVIVSQVGLPENSDHTLPQLRHLFLEVSEPISAADTIFEIHRYTGIEVMEVKTRPDSWQMDALASDIAQRPYSDLPALHSFTGPLHTAHSFVSQPNLTHLTTYWPDANTALGLIKLLPVASNLTFVELGLWTVDLEVLVAVFERCPMLETLRIHVSTRWVYHESKASWPATLFRSLADGVSSLAPPPTLKNLAISIEYMNVPFASYIDPMNRRDLDRFRDQLRERCSGLQVLFCDGYESLYQWTAQPDRVQWFDRAHPGNESAGGYQFVCFEAS
ncbi:unnamed protein product [Mycena citricolor]|uniref:F-box domain-containing protein n=1 Tax=Mycena citricolor TaxID=2018698 RepID=A0AAD2H5N3_9AGAR|nr:unnamed protein product [Mycena citricolor]